MTLNERLMALGILISRTASLFPRKESLHHARFAEIHELSPLLSSTPEEEEASLLLGFAPFSHVLRVFQNSNRRELGNSNSRSQDK
jgi:hypothetical protein